MSVFEQLEKKIHHARLIQDLSGHIPQESDVFKNMLVELKARGFNEVELLECKKEGVREVFNILERRMF
ncbi:hypothetical protein KUTeg_009278 [Tegillarca granosa]|uniref:Uncharacterized protein n=1 Tax=Tegillarca granosa TaxID=220873 RepID=A0ABQ9F728_TEGGR|nr:hypothetical protein KUTeg_009278 [Tegillarca granosa]